MASLQHLGGDKYRTRTYVTDPLTRKRRLRSRTFTASGKRAAERRHHQIAHELERETEAARSHGASFAGLVDDWLTIKTRDSSPSTMVAYRRHAKRIKSELGHLPADGVTGQMIDRWYTRLMADGMTAQNVNHVHRVLRAICRFGHRKRGLPTCPTDHASPPPTVEFVDRPPTSAAVRIFLEGDGDKTPGVSGEWGRAVKLLAHTGLRRGEVVGLRWDLIGERSMIVAHSVVELQGGGVEVRVPKGRKQRHVTLTPAARLILVEQREHCERIGESRWVFPDWIASEGKQPRRPGWVSLMWGRYMRSMIDAGTLRPEHRVRLHSLRHFFATSLLDAGVPLATVQGELGHAKASTTTDIYGHRGQRGDSMVSDVMQRALGPA